VREKGGGIRGKSYKGFSSGRGLSGGKERESSKTDIRYKGSESERGTALAEVRRSGRRKESVSTMSRSTAYIEMNR